MTYFDHFHPRKLSWEKVAEIRRKYKPRVISCFVLSKKYGVSVGMIHQIIKNKTWKKEMSPNV